MPATNRRDFQLEQNQNFELYFFDWLTTTTFAAGSDVSNFKQTSGLRNVPTYTTLVYLDLNVSMLD